MVKLVLFNLCLFISFYTSANNKFTITGEVSTNGNGQNPEAGVIITECKWNNSICNQLKNPKQIIVYTINYKPMDKAGCAAGTYCRVTSFLNKDVDGDLEFKKIINAKNLGPAQ